MFSRYYRVACIALLALAVGCGDDSRSGRPAAGASSTSPVTSPVTTAPPGGVDPVRLQTAGARIVDGRGRPFRPIVAGVALWCLTSNYHRR